MTWNAFGEVDPVGAEGGGLGPCRPLGGRRRLTRVTERVVRVFGVRKAMGLGREPVGRYERSVGGMGEGRRRRGRGNVVSDRKFQLFVDT